MIGLSPTGSGAATSNASKEWQAATHSASNRTMDHIEQIGEVGYTILENVVPADLVDELVEDLDRLTAELKATPANNSFEGVKTTRIYNLLTHGKSWEKVPVLPGVLDVITGVLDEGCLVSSLSSIAIHPGEIAQPVHADDQLIPLPKPHVPIVCNSMWALTDFTEENGATRLVPGTHAGDHSPAYGSKFETIPAEMPKGSVLIWEGSLWHGGGANNSDATRIGIAMNYCAGWVRQQENQQLGIPLETVAEFSPDLQKLCGFDLYKGLIGHIDKQTPAARFLPKGQAPVVWDR